MKLSMWHIYQALEDLRPECDIREGQPRITGLHLVCRGETGPWPDECACLQRDDGGLRVFNGPDSVALRGLSDPDAAVNRLVELLVGSGDWENRLREAARRGDLQALVDLGTEKLGNPILLFDLQGNVLAMSAQAPGDDRIPCWSACRETRRVPLGYSAQAMALESGRYASWTREPELYTLSLGTRAIGNFIGAEGEPAAGFALHETRRPIRPGDVHLVRVLQDAMAGVLRPRPSDEPRSLGHILRDMLAGTAFEESLYGMLRIPCAAPWRLMVLDNPFHREPGAMYGQLLLPRLRSLAQPCVPLEFDGHIVVLASEDDLEPLLKEINGGSDQPFFTVCLSLPFDDLRILRARYDQAAFALGRNRDRPGVFRGEDHALEYLPALKALGEQQLVHPLLKELRAHDARRHGELYGTLCQYLVHERSLQHGANAMHIHKNTFSYRLERIRELSGVDFDDPMTRLYLMVSYVLDGALPPREPDE